MKNRLLVTLTMISLIIALICSFHCASSAQRPTRNVSGKLHPNLAAAQGCLQQAYDRIVKAQRANEWDLGGHAEKAKIIIDQANVEIKLAAEASNERRDR